MSLKEKVLEALIGNAAGPEASYLSGEELAKTLDSSRNAVWKAVKQLEKEGYRIDAVPNRGYHLLSDHDRISAPAMGRYLHTRVLGRKLLVYPELDSTNNRLRELAASGAAAGTTVVADRQTDGKGRRGRAFFSPEGSGLYMSVLLRPSLCMEQAGLITSCAAVAAARAVERTTEALSSDTALQVGIKWVNDLFLNGKKLCGILTEAAANFENGQLDYAVLGIGINLGKMDFPCELQSVATSVFNECGVTVPRSRMAAAILNELEPLLDSLEHTGCAAAFLSESRERSVVLGREVTVFRGNESFDAVAMDIDDTGALVVRTPDGRELALLSGEISVRLPDQLSESYKYQ